MSLAHRGSKLLCPWHGPYRVMTKRDPDIRVEVSKGYFPQEENTQIHQSRVKHIAVPLVFPVDIAGTELIESVGYPPKSQ